MWNKKFFVIVFLFFCFPVPASQGNNMNNSCNSNQLQNVLNINFGLTPEMMAQLSSIFGGYVQSAKGGAHNLSTGTCSFVGGCYQWLMENKLRTFFYGLFIAYGYVNYQLIVLRCRLMNKEFWSMWNSAVTFDVLITMSQRELGYALVNEVQRRYTACDQPDDFFSPLMHFLQDVELEEQILKRFISLCWWLKRSYCAKIMFYNEEFYEHCEDRLRRLLYLKTVFVSWVTEYKMVRNALAPVTI